jgi:hypothetical protein
MTSTVSEPPQATIVLTLKPRPHPYVYLCYCRQVLELGNGEFKAETSALYAAQARTHYSMWCMMKAVMLLGADLTSIGPQTLAIIRNAEAVAINQDPYGNQARRIAVQSARNTSLVAPRHALVLLVPCAEGKRAQMWHYRRTPGSSATGLLYVVDADEPLVRCERKCDHSRSTAGTVESA